MADRTVKEVVYVNVLWSVTTTHIPSKVAGVPPKPQRFLRFSNVEETEVHVFPLPMEMAQQIGRALAAPVIEQATPADVLRLQDPPPGA